MEKSLIKSDFVEILRLALDLQAHRLHQLHLPHVLPQHIFNLVKNLVVSLDFREFRHVSHRSNSDVILLFSLSTHISEPVPDALVISLDLRSVVFSVFEVMHVFRHEFKLSLAHLFLGPLDEIAQREDGI